MKKNDIDQDLLLPQRQSLVAILVIIYQIYRNLIRQFWPLLLVAVVGGNTSSRTARFSIFIVGLAIVSGVMSIVSFFRYFYYVKDDELIIEKGIIRRSKLSIPIERIQTVDYEQAFIHRIFNVVKIKIDTAGSSSSEFKLLAITREKAEEIRNLVLFKSNALDQDLPMDEQKLDQQEQIVHIDFWTLLKVGATENHFRSGALIVFFGFWIYEQLEEFGLEQVFTDYLPSVEGFLNSLIKAGILTLLFVIISFLISLVRIIIKYYQFTLFRQKDGFKLRYGLINKREIAAKDYKIQILSWHQNLLQKFSGLFKVNLRQTVSYEANQSKSISIPGANKLALQKIIGYLYDVQPDNGVNKIKISRYYLKYRLRNLGLTFIGVTMLCILLAEWNYVWWFGLLFIGLALVQIKKYRKKAYGLKDGKLYIFGGAFGASMSMLETFKIQSLEVRESLYQRRRGLSTLYISTAAGSVRIPFIPLVESHTLSNVLLYHVQRDKRPWI